VNARARLVVALDVPSEAEAQALFETLRGRVGMFKVGLELFTAAGPAIVRTIVGAGEKVFLDLKLHDIPNTVRGAAASASRLGVSLLTVHGLGGRGMIAAAAEAAAGGPTSILAITVLTSHDEASLREIGLADGLDRSVAALGRLARDAGAHGMVASPREITALRAALGAGFLIVTPGIRLEGSDPGDQARVATPAAAISAGADYIVVGRPITRAPDPAAAADAIVAGL
jgi:orotidine-5'-phosphate decarboxylase